MTQVWQFKQEQNDGLLFELVSNSWKRIFASQALWEVNLQEMAFCFCDPFWLLRHDPSLIKEVSVRFRRTNQFIRRMQKEGDRWEIYNLAMSYLGRQFPNRKH